MVWSGSFLCKSSRVHPLQGAGPNNFYEMTSPCCCSLLSQTGRLLPGHTLPSWQRKALGWHQDEKHVWSDPRRGRILHPRCPGYLPRAYGRLVQRMKDGISEYPVVGFNHPFPYGLAVLGLCMSGEGRECIQVMPTSWCRSSRSQLSCTMLETQVSMLTLALSCIHKDESLKNNQTIKSTLQDAANTMVNSQKKDGSFGNSITTSLVFQVIISIFKNLERWFGRAVSFTIYSSINRPSNLRLK